MPNRRRASIRLWQTELFIVVIVVAILILSGSLSASLKDTLAKMGETNELRNAAALAQRLEPEFPITGDSLKRISTDIDQYRSIFGTGIWVYDRDGTLLEASYQNSPADAVLETARVEGLDNSTYTRMELSPNGWVVAAKVLHDSTGAREGVVVTASSVSESLALLDSVRNRLWNTFWISLIVAGLLGFSFSELIGRRIRAMSQAAVAIASGDFQQRLPTGFVPGEIYDLATSYNSMAVRLGEAFGAVQERERQITAVVESMAEGVLAFDSQGIVHVLNPEAVKLLGGPAKDWVGASAEQVLEDPEVLRVVRAGLAGERLSETVTLGTFTVLVHCTPLLDGNGRVDGAVLLLSDVTEQRRVEDAQRRFIADASHEMRTPITALKGILELLADGAKDDPVVRDDFLHTMQLEADRLGRLVTDLLTLARLEAGSLTLHVQPEWTSDLLGDVAGVMENLAAKHGVNISVEPPSSDVQVLADRDRVVQVLLSFVDNAIKHSPKGTSIHLRAICEDGGVRLEVADEGTGIGPEELSRVFERFYRADVSRSGPGGAGLGLAIAKEIVDALGSTIEVRSDVGKGTVFGFKLPLAKQLPSGLPTALAE